jgi:hypothetical protein
MKKLIATLTLLVVFSVPAFGGIIHQPGIAGHSEHPTGETCSVCQDGDGLTTEEPSIFSFDLEGAIGLLVDPNVYLMPLMF